MRVITLLITLLFVSGVELYSQSPTPKTHFYTNDFNSYSDRDIEYINSIIHSDDHIYRLWFVRHGSTDPEEIGLVTGLDQYLANNRDRLINVLPMKEIWQRQYKDLKVDTLSITNRDITSLLDYYDRKDSTTYEYRIEYKPLNLEFHDLYNHDKMGGYRRYYILRIDSLASNTIIYYHLSDKPIEDIFNDKSQMEALGSNIGYVNYGGRPILVCGDAMWRFFRRDSAIYMSPTYAPRVERTSKKHAQLNPYLYGDIKGFYIYNKDQDLELNITGEIPYWRDRELYMDDIRRMLYGNPYTYRLYYHPIESIPTDTLKSYLPHRTKKGR